MGNVVAKEQAASVTVTRIFAISFGTQEAAVV
jgi:hypothetical protein